MTDFSMPIEIVPSCEGGKARTKKDIFVDKLKGTTRCKILSVPVGSMFTVCNEVTAHIHQVYKLADNEWSLAGTAFDKLQMLETYELEEFLTEELDKVLKNGDSSKSLRMMDSVGCMEWT